MSNRTNEQWLADLRSDTPDEALTALRTILIRGLRGAIANRGDVNASDLEDFAQDAMLKIVGALDSFRGESKFTTWAQKIAIRVALTELRRLRWRDWSLDRMVEGADGERGDFTPTILVDPADNPEQQAVQQILLATLRRTMEEALTARQRIALVAVKVEGVPMEEVARRLGTNRNALYKLLHDARQRLKKALMDTGLSADEILAAFE